MDVNVIHKCMNMPPYQANHGGMKSKLDKIVLLVAACKQLAAYSAEKAFRELVDRTLVLLKPVRQAPTLPQVREVLRHMEPFSSKILRKQASLAVCYKSVELVATGCLLAPSLETACLYIGAPVVKVFGQDPFNGQLKRVFFKTADENMMPSNPLESSNTRLDTEVLFHVVYEDGDMEDMEFTEFIKCFKAASSPKTLLNEFHELRLWRVSCNGDRPTTRKLIPFAGAGCNGVPQTATDLDFGFATHAHDVETCIPGNSIRFADRLTSGYGCSCQFASHWGIPCRHRLHLLLRLNIPLTVSDINSSHLIQETQTDNASGSYEPQKPPTPLPASGHTQHQQQPKVTLAVLDQITNGMNRLAIQAKGVTKQVQIYFLYHN